MLVGEFKSVLESAHRRAVANLALYWIANVLFMFYSIDAVATELASQDMVIKNDVATKS